jgi:hypothetical protein
LELAVDERLTDDGYLGQLDFLVEELGQIDRVITKRSSTIPTFAGWCRSRASTSRPPRRWSR